MKRLLLLVAVPAVAVASGLAIWLQGGRFEETENAYVKAHIIAVSADVSGRVVEVKVRDNEPVAAGTLLFRIDPAPFEVAVAQARAELASAVAREAQARREAARLKPLIAQRAISQREYDDAMSTLDIARANLELSRARLREAELDLGYTRVTAPIGGTTGRAMKSEGSLVTANADSLQQGQDVVLNSLQARYDSGSGVSIDQEMSDLLGLQNSYAANARVMSTIKDMLASLMQLGL